MKTKTIIASIFMLAISLTACAGTTVKTIELNDGRKIECAEATGLYGEAKSIDCDFDHAR